MNNIKLNNFYIGESVEFMRENIEDEFVDLTVTSPPYDDLRKYKGFTFDYESMIKELYRVTKSGGVVVWIVGDQTHKGSETGTSFRQTLYAMEVGFNLHDTMIYEKSAFSNPSRNRYHQTFEYMFILIKGKIKAFNPIKDRKNIYNGQKRWGKNMKRQQDGDMIEGKDCSEYAEYGMRYNIWRYSIGGNVSTPDKIAFKHPAIFPDKLGQDHIISWSNEGDIVLDPMAGSGTTAKMSWLNKRNFIGIDMSEEYINEICVPRLEMYGWDKSDNIIF